MGVREKRGRTAVVPATSTSHDYRFCRDPFCQRFACRVYKEGYDDGYGAGSAAGYAAGYAQGYDDGAADTSSDG